MVLYFAFFMALTPSQATSLAKIEKESQKIISNLDSLKEQRYHMQSQFNTFEYFQSKNEESTISNDEFQKNLDNLVYFNDAMKKAREDLEKLASATNKLKVVKNVTKDRLIKLQNKQKFAIGTFEEIDPTGKTLIYFERQRLGSSCGAHAIDHLLQKPYFLFNQGDVLLQYRSLQLDMPRKLLAGGINENYGIEFLEWVMTEQGYVGEKIKEAGDFKIAAPSFEANGFLVRTGGLDGGHWFAFRRINGEWYNLDSLVSYGKWPHRMDAATVYNSLGYIAQGKHHVIIAYQNLPNYQFSNSDELKIQKMFTWGNEYNKVLMTADDFPKANHIDAVWKKSEVQ